MATIRATVGFWALAAAIAVAGTGCGIDPLAERDVPNVGTTDTSLFLVEKDFHTDAEDAWSEVEALPERGVVAVDPTAGSPSGGETVFIMGRGFTKSVEVYFDAAKAGDVFLVNTKKLRVTTPPHALGMADVSVRWKDGEVETLPSAFLYKTDLRIDSVEEATGPISGGTTVTVTGDGFIPGTRLVFGARLAISVEVADEHTIFAVTPPGAEGGPVDVIATNETGSAIKKDAFVYSVAPQALRVEPASGPVEGGQEAVVVGKWLSPVTEVWFGDVQAEILEVTGKKITVLTPPGMPGYADVALSGTWGWDILEGGYFYLSSEVPQPALVVIPGAGPEGGGNEVTVVSCDAAKYNSVEVLFAAAEAELLTVDEGACSIRVKVPAGTGTVNVKASTGLGFTVGKDAYTYEPEVTIESVSPPSGPYEGGTRITIVGSKFAEGTQVLVGPLAAADIEVASDTEISATTPPGSPGLADIVVVQGGLKATMKKAFLYTVDKPEIFAISPNYGSQAGGTYVEIVGAGFTPDALALIGTGVVEDAAVKDYCLIAGRTPPGETGTHKLSVTLEKTHADLNNAFTYFDPVSLYGGTWGGKIDGAVNVTVINAYDWGERIEDAFAVLGSDPNTPVKGFTNEDGQVTLSVKDLAGPVDLHVTKASHDAASIVHFDAENATVYLIPYSPPTPSDPVDPPDPLLPGSVQGKVSGLGKYVIPPPGDCLKKTPLPGGLCSACSGDEDCVTGRCLPIGESGKFCTHSCKAEGDDCPPGYDCLQVSFEGQFCAPARGKKAAFCELSQSSIYQNIYSMDEPSEADPEGLYDLDSPHLGEVAVVCLGGFVDDQTKEFVPMMLGVKRHVNVGSGESVLDQNILLNIPLSREVRLRMDDPPQFGGEGGRYIVSMFLNFGSDGVFLLPGGYDGVSAKEVVIPKLPEELSGDIYDASYVVIGGAYSNTDDMTPLSEVLYWDVVDLGGTSMALLGDGSFQAVEGVMQDAIYATWPAPGGTYLAGEGGAMFLLKDSGTLVQLASVVAEDIKAMWGFSGGDVFAVGEAGIVLRNDGTSFKLVGRLTDRELRSVWGSAADDLHAVGQHRILSLSGTEWTEQIVAFDLYGISGAGPDNVYAVGAGGTILFYDGESWAQVDSPTAADLLAVRAAEDGSVIAVGDGVALGRSPEGAWTDLGLDPTFRAGGIHPAADSGFYLSGESGLVAHYAEETGFTYIAAPADLEVTSVVETLTGAVYVVGEPALLLTPFIPFPVFVNPDDGGLLSGRTLAWGYKGDSTPISLHTIAIRGEMGDSLWRITADGVVRTVELADFPKLVNWEPLSSGPRRLSIYSAHSPGFDIDAFDLSDMSESSWLSWAWDNIHFE